MKEIDYKDLQFNPMTLAGNDWLAISAGNETDGYNAMTASWGQFGSLWGHKNGRHNLPTAVIYVRQTRYTHEFLEKENLFTLSILKPEYRKAHDILGSKSGRDLDKFQAAGIHPVFEDGTVYIAESRLVFICRKLYEQEIKPENFIDTSLIADNYRDSDFHTMYIGEIIRILTD